MVYRGQMTTGEENFVVVFSQDNSLGLSEVLAMKMMLESNDIPTFVRGVDSPHLYRTPSGPPCVAVPESRREEAERLIAEALENGPTAADEAEAATEQLD
jgi:hypothetical protein